MIPLEDLQVYKVDMEIRDIVWQIVERWNHFQKETLGKQFSKAADSIAFNISEGYGRFHFAEDRNFCFYSRGSAFETKTATAKANSRGLLSTDENNLLAEKMSLYFVLINPYIKSIGANQKTF